MTKQDIIAKINDYLYKATSNLSQWLETKLPKLTDMWWEQCVLSVLNESQLERVPETAQSLSSLDLAILLTVTDRNWYNLKDRFHLNAQDRKAITDIRPVRNNWAHCGSRLPGKEIIGNDLEIIYTFFECLSSGYEILKDIRDFQSAIEREDFTVINGDRELQPTENGGPLQENKIQTIQRGDIVALTSAPTKTGYVTDINKVGDSVCYTVFIDNCLQKFFEGQVAAISQEGNKKNISAVSAKSYLTAFQIIHPSHNSLYSLNSGRIEFVPYQFRPALKIIKSDQPRLLIADSVGVGKTIEAGLIMKELQARFEMESVLIICPKPLVAERKWELEMKRFDEDFTQLDGDAFRRAISDTNRDGVWPEKYSKTIIPYSLFTRDMLYGNMSKKRRSFGLLDVDAPPHFDLVIVDEAHHIRNNDTYAYEGVEYFCRYADSVVLLTATPIQTGDDNLYTLLNLLRPDIVTDPNTFQLMARPNPYVNQAIHVARIAGDQWQQIALEALDKACHTQWGSHVICKDPRYQAACKILTQKNVSREERIALVTDLEGLHSFSGMINRTRRQDIQDFCVRHCHTIEVPFTMIQKELHDGLLQFETEALSTLHGSQNIAFMLSTIRRQAASCIFGLAPFIKSILNHRVSQIIEDGDYESEHSSLEDPEILRVLKSLAGELQQKAENLPEEDPKFDSMMEAIVEKQAAENNKIIIFSSFKHTLLYLRKKLQTYGLRVAQVDGSVKDEERVALRERFQQDKNNPEALDILLFTEVGCEGLDYQFCDMMINYDLPWNPMRIEQRIGRIDRRGQKSETVNIYNMLTSDTIDADIYHRCLLRIGVFENSIGECSEILGKITKSIQDISLNFNLTEEERRIKLAQMADNEVRRVQEMRRLEQEEKQLYSVDLSNFSMNQEIQNAENLWLSSVFIQNMIQNYLNNILGEGTYMRGEGLTKNLKLSAENRQKLLSEYRALGLPKTQRNYQWERYLKGAEPNIKVTFDSECADQDRGALFVTASHPFTRQAACAFTTKEPLQISARAACACKDIPAGEYPFQIYHWNYMGFQNQHVLKAVCQHQGLQERLLELFRDAQDADVALPPETVWTSLEILHFQLWNEERTSYAEKASANRTFKLESLKFHYENQQRSLHAKIQEATEERICRMYESQLNKCEHSYAEKKQKLDDEVKHTDILFKVFANGVFVVE